MFLIDATIKEVEGDYIRLIEQSHHGLQGLPSKDFSEYLEPDFVQTFLVQGISFCELDENGNPQCLVIGLTPELEKALGFSTENYLRLIDMESNLRSTAARLKTELFTSQGVVQYQDGLIQELKREIWQFHNLSFWQRIKLLFGVSL